LIEYKKMLKVFYLMSFKNVFEENFKNISLKFYFFIRKRNDYYSITINFSQKVSDII